jgi:hypothetical protein
MATNQWDAVQRFYPGESTVQPPFQVTARQVGQTPRSARVPLGPLLA